MRKEEKMFMKYVLELDDSSNPRDLQVTSLTQEGRHATILFFSLSTSVPVSLPSSGHVSRM